MSLVSVVVPCHDLGRTLEDAVDSVFAQTWPEFEILVVDDGSTDPATRRLLRDFDWPRTRVFSRPRHAPAHALGAGLAEAKGDFVAVLDPRHVLRPTYLAKAVAAFERDPDLGVVTCWVQAGGEAEPPIQMSGLALPGLLVSCTVGPAALARREVLVAAGGFDHAFASGHDAQWDLWIRLAERGTRSAILPEALVLVGADGTGTAPPPVDVGGQEAARRLVDGHRDLYARHHLDVLAGKEALLREMRLRHDSLAQRLETLMEGERSRRGEPSERLRATAPLDPPAAAVSAAGEDEQRRAVAEAALAAARGEIEDLRRSASWRLTAPLRALHRWATRAFFSAG